MIMEMGNMSKKINLSVNDGVEFYANEVSVNFSPLNFILDFKSVVPRVDMRSKDATVLAVRHNVVLMDPYHVKMMHESLGEIIRKYEENFVKIEKPAAIVKAEEKAKKNSDKQEKEVLPEYLG